MPGRGRWKEKPQADSQGDRSMYWPDTRGDTGRFPAGGSTTSIKPAPSSSCGPVSSKRSAAGCRGRRTEKRKQTAPTSVAVKWGQKRTYKALPLGLVPSPLFVAPAHSCFVLFFKIYLLRSECSSSG